MMFSIRKRLIGTYLLIIMLTVAIIEIVLIWGIKYYYLNSIGNNLKNQAELVSSFYNNFLDSGDIYSNSEQIKQFFSSRSFQIQIIDKFCKVVADSLDVTEGEVLDYEEVEIALSGEGGRYLGSNRPSSERTISYAAPLKNNDVVVGAIRFTSSLELTYQVIYRLARYLIIFGLILITTVFIISSFIAQSIIRPVEEITMTANQMAKGNLTVRNKIVNKDEIGVLAESLNNMAEQIQNNEVMKNEFISTVSHELRTPLTSIKGWAQTLKGTPVEDETEMKYGLDIIIGETNRLSDMVEDMLDFSRLQSYRLKIYPEPIDINKLIFMTYEQMKQRAIKQGVNFKIRLANETLMCDPKRIKQVLINIIDNSLKFTPTGGEICISGKSTDDGQKGFYVITVSDTGCGISEEEIRFIKEKFYRSKKNKSDIGTGLGLAICDELIKLHGGTMEITSEVNSGTIVNVRLPL